MDLQQLQYLITLAETENYTKAANLLHISQPSLTYAIKKVEEQTGVKIIHHVGRNIQITPAGKILAHNFLNGINQINTGIEKAKNIQGSTDILTIGALRSISVNILPQAMRSFIQSNRQSFKISNFKLFSGALFSNEIISQLRAEKIDLAFCSKVDNLDDIEYLPITQQTLYFIVPIGHPLATKSSINLKDTLKYSYITYSTSSGVHFELERLFSICGNQPKSAMEVDEDETVAGMLAAGLGVGIVPDMPILANLPLKKININFPKYHRYIYLAYLKSHPQSTLMQSFISYFKHQS